MGHIDGFAGNGILSPWSFFAGGRETESCSVCVFPCASVFEGAGVVLQKRLENEGARNGSVMQSFCLSVFLLFLFDI